MLKVKQNLISSETNYLRVASQILEWVSSNIFGNIQKILKVHGDKVRAKSPSKKENFWNSSQKIR